MEIIVHLQNMFKFTLMLGVQSFAALSFTYLHLLFLKKKKKKGHNDVFKALTIKEREKKHLFVV